MVHAMLKLNRIILHILRFIIVSFKLALRPS
jgi:hypothetical protein